MDRIIAEKTREDARNTSEMLVIVKYTLAGLQYPVQRPSTPEYTGTAQARSLPITFRL